MRRSSPVRRALWWLSLAVFAACLCWVGVYLCQAYTGAQSLGALASKVALLRATTPEPALPEPALPEPAPPEFTAVEPAAEPETPRIGPSFAGFNGEALLLGYRTLAERNEDLAGWIYIEGTAVDYPVMHTPTEPEKYLHRDFEGRYSFAGLPFLDALCDPAAESANQIVYAHNMRSGQMFAALKKYLDEDFWAEHTVVHFDTLTALREYEVVAVLKLRAGNRQDDNMLCYQPFSTLDGDAVADFNDYLDRYAVLRAGDVAVGDGLLTLSTCERSGSAERLVIVARAPLAAIWGT